MLKNIRTVFLTALIFLAVTTPFLMNFKVVQVTEMRPASALPPAFGLMLGVPGALGCALGNLAADIFISGYPPVYCIFGYFPAQLLYGLMPLFLWNMIRKSVKSDYPFFRLNNVGNLVAYIAVTLVNSAFMAGLLGVILTVLFGGPVFSKTTLMLFFNNFVFGMVLGIPIVIFVSLRKLKQKHTGLSLNERLILIFLSLGIISAALIGVMSYIELSPSATDMLGMWTGVYTYIAVDITVFFLAAILFLRHAEKRITIPVESIAHLAENYISGGKEKKDTSLVAGECERFTANGGETGILAGAFRTMVLDLDKYIDNLTAVMAERERIGAELSIAAKIQVDMLPNVFPPFPDRDEFDVYASMIPAKEVGGDFYDFFFIGGNRLAVVIADVSGKGVPAALFMVVAKTLIKNGACSGKSPGEVFGAVNDMLCENNETGMFVTAFMGYIDLAEGEFTYVNAGHNPPAIKKGGGVFEFLKPRPSFVLAGFDGIEYKEESAKLSAGDTVYLYTDGVTEAMDAAGELFSERRLLDVLNGRAGLSAVELTQAVKREIDLFADGAEQADDITMIAVEYLQPSR